MTFGFSFASQYKTGIKNMSLPLLQWWRVIREEAVLTKAISLGIF